VARLLIVEDEPTIAMGLEDDLRLDGHEVEVVGDGLEAERRGLAREHDLIVLDVMLPGRDGFSVCRTLRAAGVHTPVILLTAKGQDADKVRGLQLGADDYVTKPFSPLELSARIQAVLRRAQPSVDVSNSIHHAGDLIIDLRRCEARRGDIVLDLTATEFKLLRTFLRYRGEVLSHDRLLTEVWGPDIFLTDRVIYTHVGNLRQKIERVPSQPELIVGVRGLGYRFEG
jgi:DNA-binding response OmpR family regulator